MHVQAVRDTLSQVLGCRADCGQCTTHTFQVRLTCEAHAHAMRTAFEQAHAELRFEPGNLVADCRCRQMQLGSRQGKASTACHGFEGQKVGSGWHERHGVVSKMNILHLKLKIRRLP
jgi:hypothetical protein